MTIALIRRGASSRANPAWGLLVALMLAVSCGPAITETTEPPKLTILLSPTVPPTPGCFIATPDPANVGAGQPFNFRNATLVDLELLRTATGLSLTTAPSQGLSPTIIVHTVLDHEDYYGRQCPLTIHRIALGTGTVAVALRR